MEPKVFRPMELKSSMIWAGLFTIGGIVAAVRLVRGDFSNFLDALGVTWLILLPFMLNLGFGKVVVDDRGILSWRPLWRKTYLWQDISDITVEEKSSRSNGAFHIRIYRHNGRPRWLAAPYVGLRASEKWFAEFYRQADEIKARWRAATGETGESEAQR